MIGTMSLLIHISVIIQVHHRAQIDINMVRTDTHHIRIDRIAEIIAIIDRHIRIEATMEDVARHHIEVDMETTTPVINRMIEIGITEDVVHRTNRTDALMTIEIIHMKKRSTIDLEHLILIRIEEGVQEEMMVEVLDTHRGPLVPTLPEEHPEVRREVDLAVDHPQRTDLVAIFVTLEIIEQ
jgi:hypothetical protein